MVERTALQAVAATADTAATGTVRIRLRPITWWEVIGGNRSSGGGSSSSGSSARPRWSPAGSTVIYTLPR
ncbi:MAG: hypothetical protein WAK19_01250, partial [Candidatus Cybelea sp.]